MSHFSGAGGGLASFLGVTHIWQRSGKPASDRGHSSRHHSLPLTHAAQTIRRATFSQKRLAIPAKKLYTVITQMTDILDNIKNNFPSVSFSAANQFGIFLPKKLHWIMPMHDLIAVFATFPTVPRMCRLLHAYHCSPIHPGCTLYIVQSPVPLTATSRDHRTDPLPQSLYALARRYRLAAGRQFSLFTPAGEQGGGTTPSLSPAPAPGERRMLDIL